MVFIPRLFDHGRWADDFFEPLNLTWQELNAAADANNFAQSKIHRNVMNFAAAAASSYEEEGEDYVGRWEDAFLFQGFENGQHRFLTSIIANIIGRHGFVALTTVHKPEYKQSTLGQNEIIVALAWKDNSVIPDRDINGNRVRVGLTDPRLYLPDVVQSLLDLEFGYDKEIHDRETIEIKRGS